MLKMAIGTIAMC